MERRKRKGNITKLTNVDTMDIKGSINMLDFGDGGTQRKDDIRMYYNTQPIMEDDYDKEEEIGKEYIGDKEYEQNTMSENIIKQEKEKFNKKEDNMKQSIMVFSSQDKDNSLFEQQMLAKIEEQRNKKIKPTKMQFKKKQSLSKSTFKSGDYSSINSQTYGKNNLSQSMMIFANKNNNKAKKGTDETKKIDFKKGK